MGKELYRATYILCRIKDCEVQELNIQPDHVHLVAIVLLKISIYTLMGHLKVAVQSGSTIGFRISGRSYGNHFWPWGCVADMVGVSDDM